MEKTEQKDKTARKLMRMRGAVDSEPTEPKKMAENCGFGALHGCLPRHALDLRRRI
jgi:hypothetical protein